MVERKDYRRVSSNRQSRFLPRYGFIKAILYVLLILIVWTSIGYQIACTKIEDDDDDDLPNPPDPICIDYYSRSGNYTLTADGSSTLELEVLVTDCFGNGKSGLFVSFSNTPLGFDPPYTYTDSNGNARTLFSGECIPGSYDFSAFCSGSSASITLELIGSPPAIDASLHDEALIAGGYSVNSPYSLSFSCSPDVVIDGAEFLFWSSDGCFHDDCLSVLTTDDDGLISTFWYPPLIGTQGTTNANDTFDFYEVTLRVTYREYGLATDFRAENSILIYPLHARMLVDGSQAFKEETLELELNEYVPVSVSVYGLIDAVELPFAGLAVTFQVNNSTETEAYVRHSLVYTDQDGFANTELCTGPSSGEIDLMTGITIRGLGDCCHAKPGGWNWFDSTTITLAP